MTEALADSAVATDADKKAPKLRKPKHAPEGEVGNLEDLEKAKAEKKAKRVRTPKMVQATDPETGEPLVNEDGTPVMVEAPKSTRKPAVSRKAGHYTKEDGTEVHPLGNDALDVTVTFEALKVKEGSKREARYAAFKNGGTADDFIKAGGAARDFHRLARAGSIKLSMDGAPLSVA